MGSVEKENQDVQKKKFPLLTCLVYFTLITSLVIGVTFSRYISAVQGSAGTGVARPSFVLGDLTDSEPKTVTVLASMNPSKPAQEYTFDVTNIEGTDVSEVSIGYTVTVATTNNLPLKITLSCPTATSGTSSNVECSANGTATSINLAGELKDFDGDTDTYTLKIEWTDNKDDIYSNEVDKIDVVVEWQQID